MISVNKIEQNFVEAAREIYLKTGKPGFIILSVYDILVQSGELDTIEESVNQLLPRVEYRMQQEAARKGTKELKELAHLKASPTYHKTLETELKRQAVANYFDTQHAMDNF